jgi:glycosyltransferase (activator-dependent family)
MRILFVTAPFRSHLYVQVPVAWALRTAGHDVRIAGPPDLADDIADTGLTGISVGEALGASEKLAAAEPVPEAPGTVRDLPEQRRKSRQTDFALEDPQTDMEENAQGWHALYHPDSAFDDLVSYARAWQPDLVISDPFMFTGSVAARASGAAHARLLFGVDAMAQLRSACRAHPSPRSDPMRDWLEPILRRFDCDFDEEIVVGQWTIFPMPSWIWRPAGVHYLPVRHVPFHGRSTIPEWLSDRPTRKRVCITLGLSHREGGYGVVASARDLFDAVADLDIEVVATLDAKQLESVTSLPDNVRVAGFVPLNILLPTCSAIVHSGGAGTFAAAIESAVPQILIPNVFWSEKWWGAVAMANGVEDRGAGVYACDADQLTAPALRDVLRRVLEDPSFAENAARLRMEMLSMPSPNDIVVTLERLTAEYRKRRAPAWAGTETMSH